MQAPQQPSGQALTHTSASASAAQETSHLVFSLVASWKGSSEGSGGQKGCQKAPNMLTPVLGEAG